MNVKVVFSFFILLGIFSIPSLNVSQSHTKKIEKEIKKEWQIENFSMQAIAVSSAVNQQLPIKISNNNLFKIVKDNQVFGYAFVNSAPSKTATFDYLVLLDKNRVINHTKVLVYREEYGGEIGSKRWLKQFLGKTENDRLEYKNNIDAISGATISVRSMTNAMDNFLKTVKILHQNNIL